jgi:hypothetical protein
LLFGFSISIRNLIELIRHPVLTEPLPNLIILTEPNHIALMVLILSQADCGCLFVGHGLFQHCLVLDCHNFVPHDIVQTVFALAILGHHPKVAVERRHCATPLFQSSSSPCSFGEPLPPPPYPTPPPLATGAAPHTPPHLASQVELPLVTVPLTSSQRMWAYALFMHFTISRNHF